MRLLTRPGTKIGPLSFLSPKAAERELALEVAGRARPASLHVFEVSDGDTGTLVRVRLAVAATDVPDLTLRRATLRTHLARAFGLVLPLETGNFEFDRSFALRPNDTRSRVALRGKAREVAPKLFQDFEPVELTAGLGSVGCVLDAGKTDPADFPTILALLDDFAAALESMRLKVTEARAGGRCGFCHEDIALEQTGVLRCGLCSTPIHEPCWTEHGRCPVLGCPGRPAR